MSHAALSDKEFARFQRFIFEAAGITLAASKKPLVSGRLAKRVAQHGCASYGDYLDLVADRRQPSSETQVAIDLLTTNETYFFREDKHFDLLRKTALAPRADRQALRVWSAACSSGEEVYSMAMVLDDCLGPKAAWEVLGTDISSRVLQRARTGHYVVERTKHIPETYLRKYCLRGTGTQQGTLLVDRSLRQRVRFDQVNLNDTLPQFGSFDVVFLRNVMIYFSDETKTQLLCQIARVMRPGGYLLIGRAESVASLDTPFRPVSPSVYRIVGT
jgi:chemotaxis protein methyltransferase CheR